MPETHHPLLETSPAIYEIKERVIAQKTLPNVSSLPARENIITPTQTKKTRVASISLSPGTVQYLVVDPGPIVQDVERSLRFINQSDEIRKELSREK